MYLSLCCVTHQHGCHIRLPSSTGGSSDDAYVHRPCTPDRYADTSRMATSSCSIGQSHHFTPHRYMHRRTPPPASVHAPATRVQLLLRAARRSLVSMPVAHTTTGPAAYCWALYILATSETRGLVVGLRFCARWTRRARWVAVGTRCRGSRLPCELLRRGVPCRFGSERRLSPHKKVTVARVLNHTTYLVHLTTCWVASHE